MKKYFLALIYVLLISCTNNNNVKLCENSNKIRYSKKCCPIIGNTQSMIFHVPGGEYYNMMLEKNKGLDNRMCFRNKKDAIAKGFRQSKI